MVKTIFFENFFINMLHHTSLIACLAGHGRPWQTGLPGMPQQTGLPGMPQHATADGSVR
jgi:hypothetical protein